MDYCTCERDGVGQASSMLSIELNMSVFLERGRAMMLCAREK